MSSTGKGQTIAHGIPGDVLGHHLMPGSRSPHADIGSQVRSRYRDRATASGQRFETALVLSVGQRWYGACTREMTRTPKALIQNRIRHGRGVLFHSSSSRCTVSWGRLVIDSNSLLFHKHLTSSRPTFSCQSVSSSVPGSSVSLHTSRLCGGRSPSTHSVLLPNVLPPQRPRLSVPPVESFDMIRAGPG